LAREVEALTSEMAFAKRQIEALKRKLFGQLRGEEVSEAQLNLALSELENEALAQREAIKEVIG